MNPFARLFASMCCALALSGCYVVDGFRDLASNFSGGGGYKAAIEKAIEHDQSYPIAEYGADSQVTGHLPTSLDLQYANEGTRRMAKADRRDAKLVFERLEGGQVCFVQPVMEKVFNYSDEQRARVERIGRSFSFAAELTPPLSSEDLKGRPMAPAPTSSKLEVVEVSDVQPVTARSGNRFLSMNMRRCGPAPAQINNPRFLTVVVTPSEGVELNSDPYLLVWHLN